MGVDHGERLEDPNLPAPDTGASISLDHVKGDAALWGESDLMAQKHQRKLKSCLKNATESTCWWHHLPDVVMRVRVLLAEPLKAAEPSDYSQGRSSYVPSATLNWMEVFSSTPPGNHHKRVHSVLSRTQLFQEKAGKRQQMRKKKIREVKIVLY